MGHFILNLVSFIQNNFHTHLTIKIKPGGVDKISVRINFIYDSLGLNGTKQNLFYWLSLLHEPFFFCLWSSSIKSEEKSKLWDFDNGTTFFFSFAYKFHYKLM